MILPRQKLFGLFSEIFRVKRDTKKYENKIKSYVDERAAISQEELDKISSELPKEYSKLRDIYDKIMAPEGRDYCGFWVSDLREIAVKVKRGDTKPVVIGFNESCDDEISYDFNNKTWVTDEGKRLTPGQLKKYLIDCCNEDLKVFKENVYGDDFSGDIKYMNNIIAKLRNL